MKSFSDILGIDGVQKQFTVLPYDLTFRIVTEKCLKIRRPFAKRFQLISGFYDSIFTGMEVTEDDPLKILIQFLQYGIILLLQHNRVGDILVVSQQTGAPFIVLISDPAAAHINLPP